MPDDIKLSLGVETQNASKEIKELTKSVVTDLGKIKSASKSAVDFGRVDTSAIRSAMSQFEALQAEQKRVAKEQEVLARHPWKISVDTGNAREATDSVRSMFQTLGSDVDSDVREMVESISSRLEQFSKQIPEFVHEFLAIGEYFPKEEIPQALKDMTKDAQVFQSELKKLESEMNTTFSNAMIGVAQENVAGLEEKFTNMGSVLASLSNALQDVIGFPRQLTASTITEEERLPFILKYYEQLILYKEQLSSTTYEGIDTSGLLYGLDVIIKKYEDILVAKGKIEAPIKDDGLSGTIESAQDVKSALDGIPDAVDNTTSSVDNLNTSTQGVVESSEEVRDIFADINGVSGTSTESQEPQSITEYVQRINELKAELDELQQKKADALSGDVPVSDDAFVELSQRIANTENELEATREGLRAYADEITGVAQKERELSANEAISDAKTRAVDMLASAMERVGAVADSMNRRIVAGFKNILNGIKNIVSHIKSKLIGALNNVGKSADKAFSSRNLKRSLTTLLKYTIGVRSLYFAFRKLRNMVKEGLNNLVQYDSANNRTNEAITELRTSLLYLKNAWGAAFAPIINAVYPILVQLMDMLAAVGNAIARFIAALTGQATVLQAVRVGAGDYAQSLAGAGGSAKKAADEQKKLNDRLAAFDDLNVLGKDKDDDDDKSPSGGGGGGYNPNVNDMFTRIDTPMSDLAKLLKEAWATGDGFNLGEFIGNQLLDSLLNLRAWLKGEGREQFMKIAEIIGSFIDGFISVDGLAEALFGAFADAFALAMDMINTIITPERFYKIGEFIVNGLREAVPIIVPKIGETIGNILHSAISLGFGAIQTMNEVREQFDENGNLLVDENGDPIMLSGWQEWGKSFAKAINNFFDEMGAISEETGLTGWQELGKGLSDGVIGIMDFIITAINDLDPEDIKNAIKQFLEKIDWEEIKAKGKELWDTVWEFLGETFPDINVEGIKSAIENIVTVFKDLVDDIDWAEVKDAFDNILNFIASIDASEVESAARAITGLVIAIEAIGGLTKVMGAFAVIGKIFGVIKSICEVVGVLDLAGIGGLASGTGGALAGGGILAGIAGIIVGIYGAIEGVLGIIDETKSFFEDGGTLWEYFNILNEAIAQGGWVAGFIDNFSAGIGIETNWSEWWSGILGGIDEGIVSFFEENPSPMDALLNVLPSGEEIDTTLQEWGGYFTDGLDVVYGNIGDKLDGFKENINWETFISGVKDLGADFVAGIDYWKDDPAGAFEEVVTSIKETFSTKWNDFTSNVSGVFSTFLEDIGWDEFSGGIASTWSSLGDIFEDGINDIIDFINGFLQSIVDGINTLSDMASGLGVLGGGAAVLASVGGISFTPIPHLAQGAVIPPNKEFMAVLGDQSHGTNIEAPLDTIRQAVGEEFAPYSEAIVNAIAQVVQAVNNKNLVIGDREIGKANARYESQQALIRGTML